MIFSQRAFLGDTDDKEVIADAMSAGCNVGISL